MNNNDTPESEFILYKTEDGDTRIEVTMLDETVWLTQDQMAELFGKAKSTINAHIKNIFKEGELEEEQVMKKFGNSEFSTKPTNYYNLDVIISVGYRVKSLRGTQFRIWATERLREYIVKGFTMDDQRLKEVGGGNYFDELLARIRDIRSSEKVFWRKVLDIYATSIDYDPNNDVSQQFFAAIQNKMHWAAHGHTAAEIIIERADGDKPNAGLITWDKERIRKSDVAVAKNYLNEEELNILNRIVTMYLEFADLQALNRKPMYMRDWVKKLDDFISISDFEVLTHKGSVSRKAALAKASIEYEKYKQKMINQPSPVENHFSEAIQQSKQIDQKKKRD